MGSQHLGLRSLRQIVYRARTVYLQKKGAGRQVVWLGQQSGLVSNSKAVYLCGNTGSSKTTHPITREWKAGRERAQNPVIPLHGSNHAPFTLLLLPFSTAQGGAKPLTPGLEAHVNCQRQPREMILVVRATLPELYLHTCLFFPQVLTDYRPSKALKYLEGERKDIWEELVCIFLLSISSRFSSLLHINNV